MGRIEDASFAPLNTGGAALNGNIISGAKVQFSSLAPTATPNPLDFSLVDAGGYTGMGVAAYYWDLTWQAPQALPATINQYQSACWSPDLQTMVIAVGSSTLNWAIATGVNGSNWVLNANTMGIPYSIAWDTKRQRFLLLASTQFATSADGVNWTALVAEPFVVSHMGTYSPELDMCLSSESTGQYRLMKSLDGGSTWTASSAAQATPYVSSIWCSGFGRFLVGSDVSGSAILTSTGNDVWTPAVVQGATSYAVTFAYSDGLNIVVANLNANNPGAALQWSNDGVNFNNCTGMNNSTGYALSWSPDLQIFCAVRGSLTYTSVDGKAWVAAGACGLISTAFGAWASGIGSFIYVNGASPFSVVKSTPVV